MILSITVWPKLTSCAVIMSLTAIKNPPPTCMIRSLRNLEYPSWGSNISFVKCLGLSQDSLPLMISDFVDSTRFANSSFLSTMDLQLITCTFNDLFILFFFFYFFKCFRVWPSEFVFLLGVEVLAWEQEWLLESDEFRASNGFVCSKEYKLGMELIVTFMFSQMEHFQTPILQL